MPRRRDVWNPFFIIMQLRFGLIGKPVGHSLSPGLFEEYCAERGLKGYEYRCYELEADHVTRAALRRWVGEQLLGGFNVTLPYKRQVLSAMDYLSPEAAAIGAVNCVRVVHREESDGLRLEGYNTDAVSFAATLQPLLRSWHTSALVLGTGGAAQAVAYALQTLGIDYLLVSRTPAGKARTISYAEAAREASGRTIIINATPVGMAPRADENPCPFCHLFTPRHLCYDLIYNPWQTRFLSESAAQGATTANGLAMLRLQALQSYRIWQIG